VVVVVMVMGRLGDQRSSARGESLDLERTGLAAWRRHATGGSDERSSVTSRQSRTAHLRAPQAQAQAQAHGIAFDKHESSKEMETEVETEHLCRLLFLVAVGYLCTLNLSRIIKQATSATMHPQTRPG
jgi:hypothetical protein